MKNYLHPLIVGLTFLSAIALRPKTSDDKPVRTTFFDKSGMDTSVLPGNDFFTYANGTWLKRTEIPADRVSWGSFAQLADENQRKTRSILEEAVKATNKTGTIEQLVGDLYASGMDTVTIEKRGYEPIRAELETIRGIKAYDQLIPYLVTDESDMTVTWTAPGAFLGYYVIPDDRRSSINRINFQQAGLSLPEKGYYTRTDEATKKIRADFLTYAAKLFTLTGVEPALARTKAETILTFETRLAQSHKEQAGLLDPVANYHKFAVADLSRQMPHLHWRDLLNSMGLQRIDTVLVGQPGYYRALDSLLTVTPLEVLKDRVLFDRLDVNAPLLTSAFEQAHFDFNQKSLLGQKQLANRWKRLATRTDVELGDALGQLWVKRYFPPEAKVRMLMLVNNLQIVYRQRIEKLDWMSPKTKATALTKLDRIMKKIGYPDRWKNYAGLHIERDDFYGNVQRTRQHRTQLAMAKVNQPVDRTEWTMTAPTVNAYANPAFNEVVFPAGILQFPFFDKDADDAINYGAIGVGIGHEMTHLFDDYSRHYDADGNLRDWWTKQDAERFKAKAQVIVNQYNGYSVLDKLALNGRLTLNENIADLGGITLAYQAFKLTKQGKGTEKIDGLTPDQRFFLGMAQSWRSKVRDETQRARVMTDPHSPAKFRVNGPLSNFAPFYRAFNVKPGQKLYKAEVDQAKVW
ncbi:M13 family metallopeptidase [Spirosoma sp. KUDC1026]|uniref:M13 family metallopeptidase n=1 Tax=Spirosoma sp. KUDC1026 TaxID=2745947 RepID=UPI00159BEE6D|nr:M13 family metallopeptidase [Spirosoma sp. KUDC1026]QKZ13496.1 M13 family metallopeptidase [Spirosoma sp. KUDC1026]